jgi:hypothetical protein
VRNAAYIDLVIELAAAARQSLLVEVFYFTSAANGPGARLLAALTQAKNRGVDVRLIVDTDLHDDIHGASRVNAATIEQLRAAGIAFRLDGVGTTSHSKTLVVDRERVVTGSHNWTAHAMYSLDETSLYVESAALGQVAATRFEHLWAAYDPRLANRRVHLSLLRFPLPNERRTLAAEALDDSRSFMAVARTPRGARALGERLGLAADRVERLWSLFAFMHELGLPEPTAFALAEAGLATPGAVRNTSLVRLRALLTALGELTDPYGACPIRIDAVEAARG